jgi:hypothetical protein
MHIYNKIIPDCKDKHVYVQLTENCFVLGWLDKWSINHEMSDDTENNMVWLFISACTRFFVILAFSKHNLNSLSWMQTRQPSMKNWPDLSGAWDCWVTLTIFLDWMVPLQAGNNVSLFSLRSKRSRRLTSNRLIDRKQYICKQFKYIATYFLTCLLLEC